MVSPTNLNPIKKLTKAVFILFLIGLVISSIMVWQIADSVVHPPRRDLQDYHHYWLQHSADEGISITHYDCASGKMPCIFVKPKAGSTLGVKGQHIRGQLTDDFGRNLPAYQDYVAHPQGIVVLLHGRMGRKEDMLPIAARLVASGFVCVLLDMPAHGESPLISSQFGVELAKAQPNLIEQSLQDGRQWLSQQQNSSQLVMQPPAEILPAYLWGMSMGGSYANYALASQTNQSNWQGLIIVSSFAHMQALVDSQADKLVAPLPEPLQRITKPILLKMLAVFIKWQGGTEPSRINPADVAGAHDLPVLQFHGDADTLIDIGQGKQLLDSYSSADKTWIPVAGAGHNNVLVTKAPVYATMADWMLDHNDKLTTQNNLD